MWYDQGHEYVAYALALAIAVSVIGIILWGI
jgi:hypothetical protein